MSSFWSLLRVELGPHHLSPGRTLHTLSGSTGSREFAPFKSLEIVTFEGDSGFYLMHLATDGTAADTWHGTLDDAKHQAEWEFGIAENEWVKTERPF